jgi:hypothetical protein
MTEPRKPGSLLRKQRSSFISPNYPYFEGSRGCPRANDEDSTEVACATSLCLGRDRGATQFVQPFQSVSSPSKPSARCSPNLLAPFSCVVTHHMARNQIGKGVLEDRLCCHNRDTPGGPPARAASQIPDSRRRETDETFIIHAAVRMPKSNVFHILIRPCGKSLISPVYDEADS